MRALLLSLLVAMPVLGQTTITQTIREDGTGDFTTLAAWEAQGLDLVGSDQQLVAEIGGSWSAPETVLTTLYITSFFTDFAHGITIRTVGPAKHQGVFQAAGTYYLEPDFAESGRDVLSVGNLNVTVEGLQVVTVNSVQSIANALVGGTYNIIRNCLVSANSVQTSYGISASIATSIVNCHVSGASFNFVVASGADLAVFANCTARDGEYGFSAAVATAGNRVDFVNCIASDNSVDDWDLGTTVQTALTNYNISDRDGAPGPSVKHSVTPLWYGYPDTHLSPEDTVAVGFASPSPLPGKAQYTDDYEGHARGSLWDCGADQLGSGGPTRGQVIITSQ